MKFRLKFRNWLVFQKFNWKISVLLEICWIFPVATICTVQFVCFQNKTHLDFITIKLKFTILLSLSFFTDYCHQSLFVVVLYASIYPVTNLSQQLIEDTLLLTKKKNICVLIWLKKTLFCWRYQIEFLKFVCLTDQFPDTLQRVICEVNHSVIKPLPTF